MPDDVARALGASAPGEIEIAGKKCRLRPLTIKELTEVQRDGVRQYRKKYLESIKDSIEFLPNGEDYLRERIEESARWEAEDLPKKEVFDLSGIGDCLPLRRWLIENLDVSGSRIAKKEVFQKLTAAALDGELLSEAEFTALVGKPPKKTKTSYINWWVTGSPEGMLSMIWQSVKDAGVSRQEVETLLSDPSKMMLFSREVENLSVPDVGNG